MFKIIEPHRTKSREVKEKDVQEVLTIAPEMLKLLFKRHGLHRGGVSITHSQVTSKKPLRFFVTNEGIIVANPEIINHTKSFVDSKEACLSFPDKPQKIVPRYNKITVEYYILKEQGLGEKVTSKIGGRHAKVFQHEIDHFDAKYIY